MNADAPPDTDDVYGLSPLQEGMLVHTLQDPGVGMYINQAVYVLHGIDLDALRGAWEAVVNRHSILRSSFHWENREAPEQVVHRAVTLPFAFFDYENLRPNELEAQLREFLREDRMRGFDLTAPPLVRLTVFRTGPERYLTVLTHHHIVLDGWSSPILLHEMRTFYDANLRLENVELPEPRPYREYIDWLQKQDPLRTEEFWRSYLGYRRAPTPLPADRGIAHSKGRIHFGSWALTLDADKTAALQSAAKLFHVTLNNLVHGAWAILLSRYSGEEEVLFGVLVSGRPPSLKGVESMVGMFLNTVPLKVSVRDGENFPDWIRAAALTMSELKEYEHSSLLKVQEWSDLPPGTPLFGSIVASKDTVEPMTGGGGATEGKGIASTVQQNYPLHLDLATTGGKLTLNLTYDARRFANSSMTRLMEQLGSLLEGMSDGTPKNVGDLALMREQERHRILVEWNRTDRPIPDTANLATVFEGSAARFPDSDAVISAGERLSYRDLNAAANRLAHHLRSTGISKGSLVGLSVPRSTDMAVALLAVLKSGAAYVPLDPRYPKERLRFMLEDSGARHVLTVSSFADTFAGIAADTLCLDDDADRPWELESPDNLAPVSEGDDLAYILYTSGSTGTPKGVAIPHSVSVNRLFTEHDPVQPGENFCAKTSLSFVDSIWELFSAWCHGAKVTLIADDDLLDPERLVAALAASEATRIVLVPSLLRNLLEADLPLDERLPHLLHWISSGEPLTPDLCRLFSQKLPGRILTNLYGTSEVWDATRCDSRDRPPGEPLPIGKPMGNVRTFILDPDLRPVPVGVPGELFVGGKGLALGYWNRPDLTAEKFITDPFSSDGGRLYRTGDLVRWLPDGNIEHLGRLDQQFKLRGFRIEAGEIETVLRRHPGIKHAAVTVAPNEQLAAYLVPSGPTLPPASDLRDFVREHLPEHMHPTLWIPLDTIPLTPSGKIDRRSLPSPDAADNAAEPTFEEPATDTEKTVARIWSGLLNGITIGRNDNFFDLGGHSLLATRTAVRLGKELGITVPLKSLFESPTVASLAAWIDRTKEHGEEQDDDIPELTRAERGREAPLSFAQRRLWFLDQLNPGSVSYTLPSPVHFRGEIDTDALQRAFLQVVTRHESLRTTFIARDGEPFQVVHDPPTEIPIPLVDLTGTDPSRREFAAQQAIRDLARQPWDLTRGPLYRLELVRITPVQSILALTMHHIITDGRSNGILARELAVFYRAFSEGRNAPIPDPPLQYADFAVWQRNWLQGDLLARQLAYWKGKLGGAETLDLPTDHIRPPVHRFNGGRHAFHLPHETAQALDEIGRQSAATKFMTLLAGFQIFLSRYAGQNDISVGTPVANRNRQELENVFGFFVNTLVMRTEITGDPSFRELLDDVRHTCLDAFDHQDVPFEKLVDALQPRRDLSRHPLFQVMHVHQEKAQSLQLPGMSWSHRPAEFETANFDLLLVTAEAEDGCDCTLQYNTDLFDPESAERIASQITRLFGQLAAHPDRPLSEISLLSDSERELLLGKWSGAAAAELTAHEDLLHDLIEPFFQKDPDHLVAESPGLSLTYGDLGRRANLLALHLQSLGAGPDQVVGLFVNRSPNLLVGLLGILKSGAAFLPLDPAYPADRIAFMLDESNASLVVTESALRDTAPHSSATLVDLDDFTDGSAEATPAPSPGVRPSHLAYQIFTSGSSGLPKGVQVEHRNAAAIIKAQIAVFQFGRDTRALQMIALSFDASIGEIFRTNASGATLVFEDKDRLLPGPDLVDVLREKRITALAIPPSALAVHPHGPLLPDLRTVTVGGESCPPDVAARWGRGRRIINGYGPSETTIEATASVNWNLLKKPPIGFPIPGATVYILDKFLNPVPIGIPGELYIGGVGVARGYLNRPAQTAESFLPDPFGPRPGKRIYRSGDLARWLPDGQIDFLGRVDKQVKIRGYRIELGEIESVLAKHPQVAQCVVDPRQEPNGTRRLVGYFVPMTTGATPKANQLRTFLQEKLPDYMVPLFFVPLTALPITSNGKIDRSALPDPTESIDLGHSYVAPESPLEILLAGIWASTLGLEKVGAKDNFFEIGGDSILSIQMLARASQEGIALTPKDLFQHQTVEELAKVAVLSRPVAQPDFPLPADSPPA